MGGVEQYNEYLPCAIGGAKDPGIMYFLSFFRSYLEAQNPQNHVDMKLVCYLGGGFIHIFEFSSPGERWCNLTTAQYFSNGLIQPPPSYELGPSSTMPWSRRFHLGLGHWFWSFSRESFEVARGVQKGKVGHRFWYDQGLFQHVFVCFVFFFIVGTTHWHIEASRRDWGLFFGISWYFPWWEPYLVSRSTLASWIVGRFWDTNF